MLATTSQMGPSRLSRAMVIGFVASSLFLSAPPARAQDGPDIVGLRLGITEDQAMSALKAHAAGMQFKRMLRSYSFSDGVKGHSTPQHLQMIQAATIAGVDSSERFQLLFSSPPGEQRLISITRDTRLANPPTAAQLEAQLIEKYGPPLDSNSIKAPVRTTIVWAEKGKPTCWRSTQKTTVFTSASSGAGSVLNGMRNAQSRGIAPKDLSQCGHAVGALIEGEPARSLRVYMTDFAAWAVSDQGAEAWVDGLRQDATRARLSAGSGPKL